MAVFNMSTDRYFICGFPAYRNGKYTDLPVIYVYESNSSEDTDSSWKAQVGPGEVYGELEIYGQRFQGERLQKLASDLFETKFIVNRQGYCRYHLTVTAHSRFDEIFGNTALRFNDLFPWHKYGVYPTNYTTAWTRQDLFTRRTLVDNQDESILELRDKLSRCERSLQQKEDELRDSRSKVTDLEKEAKQQKKDLEDKDKIIKEKQKTIDGLNTKVVSLIDLVTAFNDALQNP